MTEDTDEIRIPSWENFGKVCVVALLVQLAITSVIYLSFDDWSTRGTFGDMFGAANALFSSIAFVGILFAILLQRQELTLQRKELSLTREELQKTAAAQEMTARLMKEQLEVHRRMRARIIRPEIRCLDGDVPPQDGKSTGIREFHCRLVNNGPIAKQLKIELDSKALQLESFERDDLVMDDEWKVTTTGLEQAESTGRLHFEDAIGNEYSLPFILFNDQHGFRLQRGHISMTLADE